MRCAVIGAGAWGTALADLLAINGHDTSIWALEPDVAESINTTHENRRFLAGFADLRSAARHELAARRDSRRGARRVRDAVGASAPSRRASARRFRRARRDSRRRHEGHRAGHAGAHDGRRRRRSSRVTRRRLSGPSFAAEVAARQPTAIVAASTNQRAALVTQQALSNTTFRVYTHDDVIGVELGGSLKNVMAVATGIVEGVGLGHNARAALITRGLHEMTRLGVALGARASTFAGLAGVGDLVLTCTGALEPQPRARHRDREGRVARASAGREGDGRRGRGHGGERAGARARHGVDMPIVEMVQPRSVRGSRGAERRAPS